MRLLSYLCTDSLPSHVPQILINREPLRHLNFDVELLGDCDVIVGELCHHLGGHFSELCSSPSAATEVTIPATSETMSDGGVSAIPSSSASAPAETESAMSDVYSVASSAMPTAIPVGSSLTVEESLTPTETVEDAVGDVVGSSKTSNGHSADAFYRVQTSYETAVGKVGVDDVRDTAEQDAGESSSSVKTQPINWTSLLKRMSVCLSLSLSVLMAIFQVDLG